MTESGYWEGTVVCPRKGLSHISHTMCLNMHNDSCGSCVNKDFILEYQEQERLDEIKRKEERQALIPVTRRGKKRGE